MKNMKTILMTTLMLLGLCAFGQDTTSYSTAPFACCDSLDVGMVLVYSDGKPNDNPSGLQTKVVWDSTNNIIYTNHSGAWKSYGKDYDKIAFGTIYWNGTEFALLNDDEHFSYNFDSVTTTNGEIRPYTTFTLEEVGAAFFSNGGFTSYGIQLDGGFGLSYSTIHGYMQKPYSGDILCSFINGAWVVSHYDGAVHTNPSVVSWDSTTMKLTVKHSEFLSEHTRIKVGGQNSDSMRVHEVDVGYAYDKTTLQMRNFQGNLYHPQNGDWFTVERTGKKGSHTTLNNTFYSYRISDWTFLPDPTNLFFNFEIVIIGD